ncbi:MAG: SLBB domain-containing protein [Prevotellaceae bacterium]|nr:SLBB domain-containing protein [Prevotellaceae bacterium]
MKKIIVFIMFFSMIFTNVMAQSSMTDSQVAEFVQKEAAKGTPQSQIVTRLMQNGVDISQIRRVKKMYERQKQNLGLGSTDQTTQPTSRLRTNNGKKNEEEAEADKKATATINRKRAASTTQRIQGNTTWKQEYDENDQDFLQMQNELLPLTKQKEEKDNEEKEDSGKKVFGRDIFNNKNLTFEPAMNIATPQSYMLGPGDVVAVDVYGASQKTFNCTVSPDGQIVIEGFGPIQVGGLSIASAKARIRSTLGSRYRSSRINLSLGQTRTITVNVMGEVKVPGTYTLSAFATVFHALYMAGGTNDIGTLRNIKIYRNNHLISVCDIYDYILNGKMTGNVRLNDGDVISVGPYDCLVDITGKVKRPMYYEMKKNESVGTLLKYAGGFTGDAYTKAVRVNRKTGREYAVFNVDEFDMNSFRIADGDSVTVDSVLPRYHNTVEIKGAVFRPGMYQLGDGINSVRTLIQHAEGLTEDAFTNRAVMHRMNEDRTLKVIPVDIKGIMSGKIADIPLKENDVLFIPSKQIAMTERTITIQGEVQYPGIYKYADNETLEDLVLQAGGLKDAASTVKVDIARRVVIPHALTTDSIIAQNYTFALKDGFVIDGEPGFVLQPFDEVYVRKNPSYSVQQNVSIEGEAQFPGTYTLSKRNARLTDLLKAAGGITDIAYIKGARLERQANADEKARMEAAYKMQQEQLQQQLLQLAASSQNSNIMQAGTEATKKQLEKFQVPNSYPVGIELDKAISNPQSDANIVLRAGDRLILPRYTATVKINGAVMYPNVVSFQKGKSAHYYINAAGGYAQNARKGGAYIIYMNGMVAKAKTGAKIEPGCEIVVPSKITRKMSIAETMSLGTGMASIAAMIATIANVVK